MNLMRTYILCRCQVHIIVNRTFPRVQSGDSLHFLFGQCEIKNRKVLYHPFLAYGFGDNHHIALVQPAEDNLTDCPSMLFGNGFQYGIVPDVVLPFGKRCPCFVLYAFALQELVGGFLLEERVGFQLIDGRFHFVVQEKVLQAFIGEARHADGSDSAFFIKPLASSLCRIIVAVGLVQQVEVDIIQPEQL